MDILEMAAAWKKRRRRRQRQLKVSVFVIALIALALNSATNPKSATTVIAMSFFSNNSKRVPRIDQWKVSRKDGTLTGIVIGHPILEDGDEITTSPLSNPDFAEDGEGTIVTTMSGSKYKLERPKNKENNHKQSSLIGFFMKEKKVEEPTPPLLPPVPSGPIMIPGENTRKLGEPIIDDWKIDTSSGRLVGVVTGHPILPDGDFISASPPIENNYGEGSIITTETGSRYKLKSPKTDSKTVSSPLVIKPQPPAPEVTQQEIDDAMAKLDDADSSGGKMLGAVAAAGVAGVLGLNVANDPNSIIGANFNDARDYDNNKIMTENRSNRITELKEQQRAEIVEREARAAEKNRLKQQKQKEREVEVAEQTRLRELQERVKQEEKAERVKQERLQQQEIERARRLEEEATAGKAVENFKQEREQRQIALQKLQEERAQARLRLETAEMAKKEAERKVAANEKAKVELQRRQEELELLRKQRRQQKESQLLQQQERQEQRTKAVDKSKTLPLLKEKIKQEESFENVFKEAEEAQALSKELEQRLKSEKKFSIVEAIQTGMKGVVTVGFTGAAGLVTVIEIRRRMSEESIEKTSEVTENSSIGKIGKTIDVIQTPVTRFAPPKKSFATNITEKLKFVDEIDDLLAEVEVVLAEVKGETSESVPTRQMADSPSQIEADTIPVHFSQNSTKKGLIGESSFRSQIVSSDDSSPQGADSPDPTDTSPKVTKEEEISPNDVEEEISIESKEKSRTQAEEEVSKEERAAQIKMEELVRLEDLARLEAEVEENIRAAEIAIFRTEEEEESVQAEEAARLYAEEEARVKAEQEKQLGAARLQAEKETRIRAEQEEKLEAARLHAQKEARMLQIEENALFDKKKEVSVLEKVRRKLLGERLREQKDAYDMILEQRRKEEEDRIAAELKVAEEKKKWMIEEQAALQAEKKKHDKLLYYARRKLLAERMKEQRLSFELELEKRKIELQQKEELTRHEMLQAQRKIEKVRKEMLTSRLKEQTKKVKEESVQAELEAKVKAEEARIKAEKEAKLKAEQDAKVKAEKEARLKAEQEAKAENEAKIKAEQEAKEKAEEEARLKAEQEKAKAEEEARIKAEEEAKLKAEQEAKAKAEEEVRIKAEEEAKMEEARLKAEQEARAKAEEEARMKAEEAAKLKAEQEAKKKAKVEEEARIKAEEAKLKAEQEAKAKAEAARLKVEQEVKAKAEEEARVKAEEEAKLKAEQEAKAKVEEEARIKAEEEAKLKAEQEALAKAEEEARIKAEQEAKAAEEARLKVEQEVKAKAEEEARVKAEEEAKLKAEQEAKAKVEEEARIKAEEEAKLKAEQEALAKAEEEARIKAEQEAEAAEEARLKAEQEAKVMAEEKARIEAEQDAKDMEEARVKAEQEAKAEDEARIKAEQKAKAKTEEDARIKAEQEAKAEEEARAKAEEEARIKAKQEVKAEEEARVKAEQEAKAEAEEEARLKTEQKAKAKMLEEARVKADEEARLQAEHESRTIQEGKSPTGETRLSELERLEKEFGLSSSVPLSHDKVLEPVVPAAEYRKTESSHEGGRRGFEKIEQQFDSIQKEQAEVTARLMKLESSKNKKLKSMENRDAGVAEDLDPITTAESQVIGEGVQESEVKQVDEALTSQEQNLVDEESKKLTDRITESDDLYIPSEKALASTPLLIKEVSGESLENYNGKEGLFSERDVGVYAGNTLKVPVRVTSPGTIVEFSIEKKSYDFSFGIDAFLDGGQVAKIKETSLFRKKSDTQRILVPAGSAPCTMQFAFTNTYSTLLEKVRVGYKIRVTPPSAETLKLGRDRRTKSSLNFLESEILSQREILQKSTIRVAELERDTTRLQDEINKRIAKLESIQAEEECLKNLLGSARSQSPTIRINRNNNYFNEFK